MKLYIDLQGAQTGSRRRGIGRYTRDLVEAIAKEMSEGDDLYLGWNSAFESPISEFDRNLTKNRVNLISAPYGTWERPSFSRNVHDIYQAVNDKIFRNSISKSECRHVLFSSIMETDDKNFNLPLNLNFLPDSLSYSIVYDVIPYLFQEHYLPSEPFYMKYMAHLNVKLSADTIFAISEKTRADIIDIFNIEPERIINIGAGISKEKFKASDNVCVNTCQRYGINRQFIFFLGGDEFRKNIFSIVESFRYLSQVRKLGTQIVLSGRVSGSTRERIFTTAKDIGLPDDAVVFTDYLSDDELTFFYTKCIMTVIPSIYEGFGLPVLEAMASNSTVIASNNTSMVEIIDDDRFLFDPYDRADIARCIEFVFTNNRVVANFKRRYSTILRNYTWDIAARKILNFMKSKEIFEWSGPRRVPCLEVDILLLGGGTPQVQSLIEHIARGHYVTLFANTNKDASILTWSVPIMRLSDLAGKSDRLSPTVVLVTDAADFAHLIASGNLSDKILVFSKLVFGEIWHGVQPMRFPRYKKINRTSCREAMAQAFSVWILTENGGSDIYSFSISEAGTVANEAGQAFDGAVALVREVQRFKSSDPRALVKDINVILKTRKISNNALKKISEAASVSTFHWKDLTEE